MPFKRVVRNIQYHPDVDGVATFSDITVNRDGNDLVSSLVQDGTTWTIARDVDDCITTIDNGTQIRTIGYDGTNVTSVTIA